MTFDIDSLISGGGGSVGLVTNPVGVPFKCGTCEYFNKGVCMNKNPKLFNRPVRAEWCCNLYDRQGMRRIA